MEKNINLEELAREEARRYKAEWRKKNKELVRASNQRYWVKKALQRVKQEGENVNDKGE